MTESGLLVPLALVEVAWGQMLERPWKNTDSSKCIGIVCHAKYGQLGCDRFGIDCPFIDGESIQCSTLLKLFMGKKLNVVPVERIEYFARDG